MVDPKENLIKIVHRQRHLTVGKNISPEIKFVSNSDVSDLGSWVHHVVDINYLASNSWLSSIGELRPGLESSAALSESRVTGVLRWLRARQNICYIWTRLCVDSPPLAPALLWTFEARGESRRSRRSPKGCWVEGEPLLVPCLLFWSVFWLAGAMFTCECTPDQSACPPPTVHWHWITAPNQAAALPPGPANPRES